ncbi:MAG TPA: HEAT repeat domain-containing protein, partial [Candidatus Polarisedimenticolia bacterium]|nr:HEAT repeat domain-containing protein [Candidatus Polarisedimenticolia bacterium]
AGALGALALFALFGPIGCAPAEDPEKLLTGLTSSDAEERQESAEKLEEVVRRGDASVFLRGLDSPSMLVRAQSITFLARVNTPEAKDGLRGLLAANRRMELPFNPIRLRPESTARADSRILAASLIQRTGGDPKAIDVLLDGAEEGKTIKEIVGACLAVGALRDPKGITFLDRAALHPEPEVVRAAVQAMAPFDGPEVLPSLRRLASDPRPEVRADVVVSLANHTDPEARSILMMIGGKDDVPEIRTAAWDVLSRQPPDAVVPYFIEQLRGANDQTRTALLEVLGRLTGQSLGAKPDAWARFWATAHPPAADPVK